MRYTVKLENITDNDQLVLRLIFSLSEKARGRSHSFQLAQDNHYDICIAQGDGLAQTSLPDKVDIVLSDQSIQTENSDYTIRKPLIASRVLSVLDRYVLAHPPQSLAPDQNAQTPDETHETLDFCISEEEASELAIVDDETLSNPANESAAAQLSATHHDSTANIAPFMKRQADKENEVSPDASPEAGTRCPHALIVDDSPSVRKQIELELALFHVEVSFADSVAAAEARLEEQDFDVAFLDVVLPDGEGFTICRNIKAKSKQTRVVMLTGKATAVDKIKGTMAGCDAYLVKPVGRITFQNTVCQYLQLREQLETNHGSQSNPEKHYGNQ